MNRSVKLETAACYKLGGDPYIMHAALPFYTAYS